MKNRDAIRANERYKSISRTLFQFGAALGAAAVVKVYSDKGIGLEAVGWLATSFALIWVGWLILGLLDSEDL